MHHSSIPSGLGHPVVDQPHCLVLQPIVQQRLYEDLIQDSAESLTEVRKTTEVWKTTSPLIHQASDFIIEACQVSKVWLPFGESISNFSNDLFLLHVPGKGLQDKLFYHPPRD